ncbi:hypothetical protein [Adhaeribacter pallidiroseus]|uniref:Uncharacterized protein n=1 Tax=Adhaeribacter pallidiroseus TaxID=2072847 RepID=A0A369QSK1_9BACT|nr:hypothetical protein [Adhaeribacter pallidiroseus]RDC65799.1 hypothetical protein AHMF7616_04429 [Adhaeribacter pallidiroseus]
MDYPWYTVLEKDIELQQGDFIPECPIIIPPTSFEEGEEYDIEVQQIDSIIMSQSCDLVNGKIAIVLVCPYYSLKTFVEGLREDEKSKRGLAKVLDNLRKGHLPGYHLLDKDAQIDSLHDYQVVDFKNVYGINFGALQKLAESLPNRIRLLPPYREHLSQAFARYFMRVGLPQDIKIEGY